MEIVGVACVCLMHFCLENRNKKRDEVDVLFEEPFCGVCSVPTDHVPSKEQAKIKELSAKLQTLSV